MVSIITGKSETASSKAEPWRAGEEFEGLGTALSSGRAPQKDSAERGREGVAGRRRPTF